MSKSSLITITNLLEKRNNFAGKEVMQFSRERRKKERKVTSSALQNSLINIGLFSIQTLLHSTILRASHFLLSGEESRFFFEQPRHEMFRH